MPSTARRRISCCVLSHGEEEDGMETVIAGDVVDKSNAAREQALKAD